MLVVMVAVGGGVVEGRWLLLGGGVLVFAHEWVLGLRGGCAGAGGGLLLLLFFFLYIHY